MNYQQIYNLCKKGEVGLIPGWKGYLKYNYGTESLQFVNGDYILDQDKLEPQIKNRTDLYYII